MSVQLVLFPQEAINSNEFIVDGLDFTSINSATSSTVGFGIQAYSVLSTTPPTQIGTWYKFRNLYPSSPSMPDEASGDVTLYAIDWGGVFPFNTGSGIYQKISGLIAGNSYILTVNKASGTGIANIHLNHYNANLTLITTASYSTSTASMTLVFTALNTNIMFIYISSPYDSNFIIEDISLTGYVAPDYTGQVICDLYEDEEIPLTLSVDNFKNVAEKIQSYSKDFNLPATKRNNKIFGSIFEITRSVANAYDFNPYVFTRAVLKQDGFILFDGALRLIDIQDKEGEISYNVNLYAQTIALADILKTRTFDNVDFSELDHTYSKVAIKASWYTNGLPLTNALPIGTYAGTAGASVTDVLKYPFVDWTHQMLYANGATGNNATLGFPELTSLEQAFRPWIKITYLLDRIFSEAGYTYSSTLFDSTRFNKLFMDFNWGGDKMPAVIGDTSYTATYYYDTADPVAFVNSNQNTFELLPVLDFSVTGGQANSHVPPDYHTTGADIYKIVATEDNVIYDINYRWVFYNASTIDTIQCRWQHYKAVGGITDTINFVNIPVAASNLAAYSGNVSVALNTGDKLFAEYTGTDANPTIQIDRYNDRTGATLTFNLGSALVLSSTLNSLRGKLSQWDFLKGLLTMFNLVTLQDKTDPANIIIEPYGDVFITTTKGTSLAERSIQHDWTDKVDLKDVKLKPLNDLKKTTTFKYDEESDDYVFNMYKISTRGHLYGSKVFSAEGLTLLEGSEEIVATPFAATVSKPLTDQLADFITPAIYSMESDGTTSGFDSKPRILYNTTGASPTTMSTSYYIPQQNGEDSENSFQLFTFSHLTDTNPTVTSSPPVATDTFDYNFGECQYINPIGDTVSNNLFNTYWLPYYNQLYNPDTKTMTLKVNLQPADIATFKFSDYVMIKNRSYRVNRIDYKPSDLSTVEFILVN